MLTVRMAFAVAVLCCAASAPLPATNPLTLDDAFQRVLASHPDLAVLRYTEAALAADVERAKQPPPLTMVFGLENVLGTGSAAGLHGAELTWSLASIIERSDKRQARTELARQTALGTDLQSEAKRLDLLAEVARRYLDATSTRQLAKVLAADLAQRERLVEAIVRRERAGLAPAAEGLAAEAARLRVLAALDAARRQEQHALRRLSLLWGESNSDYALVAADMSTLPAVPNYDALARRLEATPELRHFAHAGRLREARLQLARSAGMIDIAWQVGVRRLQTERDWGLVGSVAIPLGSSPRSGPGVRTAEAELAAIEFEREGNSRALQATLAEVWSQLDRAVAHAQVLDSVLLPALQSAADAAEQAYRAGATGFLEWAQLQTEVTAARRERLDASLVAHRAVIELQRLTGETFRTAAGPNTESTP